jgi:signal transduction histidine kinase
VGTPGSLIARARAADRRAIDALLAVLLTACALVDASSHVHRGPRELAIVPLVLLTGSVAWRRSNPWLTTALAVSGFVTFQLVSGYTGGGAFEVAAIALNFYLLGRRSSGRERVLGTLPVFGAWLVGTMLITYSQPGGSVGGAVGAWALVGGLPFAMGRALETRAVLTRELEVSTARLAAAQAARAGLAAAEERNRMARELHDVIAHDVSVMVLQSTGARGIAGRDVERARAALEVVENAGRDALVELRRIVGVLHRGDQVLGASAAPGLAQLDALVDRARTAGLPVTVRLDGLPQALPPGVDLVAYRVVQEALTNAIKHAGPARAQVDVSVADGCLALVVCDDGHGGTPDRDDRRENGHGLLGMEERVSLYGGDLHAGPRTDAHGFEVRARMPLDGARPAPLSTSPASRDHLASAPGRGAAARWFDPACAGALLLVLELGVLTSGHRHGPPALNMLAVLAVALAAVWRRRSPLWFLAAVAAPVVVMNSSLTPLDHFAVLAAYFLLVPAYTVAAWLPRRQAALGLAFLLASTAISVLIARHQPPGTLAGAGFAIAAAWAAGRAMRARRALNSELRRTRSRLMTEREDRAQLAVVGERSRIAGELHAIVARSVAGMVVQAEGARSLLAVNQEQADVAMGAIEDTGRQTLAEMRRLLGVLRHGDDRGVREPQPGVGQVYALIERARERGQQIELRLEGEPGTLAAGVDLALFRILEDALESTRHHPAAGVGVTLRFREDDLELRLTTRCPRPRLWPTETVRERIALCDGTLEDQPFDAEGWQFVARMPRGLHGALT